ncbi:MAG: 5' nucleotidase, NT5C type, partial [Bacillota bacterium]
MSKPVLLFDLDGVCCNLMKKWLAVYNHDYSDNLTEADITSWNWDDFVKPECGKRIYHYLNRPGFFA